MALLRPRTFDIAPSREGERYRRLRLRTENPGVGGSIPSLPTIVPFTSPILTSRRFSVGFHSRMRLGRNLVHTSRPGCGREVPIRPYSHQTLRLIGWPLYGSPRSCNGVGTAGVHSRTG